MEIEVALRVSGIDLDDATTGEILANRFPQVLWQGEGADLVLTVTVDEAKAPSEVLEIVRELESVLPAFRALRVDRDLVSTSDVAHRVGVSREAARKWGKEVSFPAPFATVGDNMHVWLWSEVLAWMDTTRGINLGERALTEAEMVQIDNCLMRNPDATSIRWETVDIPEFSTGVSVTGDFRDIVHLAAWKATNRTSGVYSRSGASFETLTLRG